MTRSGPETPRTQPRPFTARATLIWTVALLVGGGLVLFTALSGRDRLLQHPQQYLDRVLGRELDAAETTSWMPWWQKAINAWEVDTPGDALKEAIETYEQFERDDVINDDANLQRSLAVLLGEAGRTKEALAQIKNLP